MNSSEPPAPETTELRRPIDGGMQAGGHSSISILAMMRGPSPLPPPEQIAAYPPEARELIYRLAQATQTHQHNLEIERLELRRERLRGRAADRAAQRRQIARGQYLGFSICALFLIASVTVALWAASAWGQLTASLLGGIGLSSLVFVFMRGRHPKARPEPTSGESRTALPVVSRAQSN